LPLSDSFVCLRCSCAGCINIQGHDCIDVIIITLYALEVEVEKIDGFDFAVPDGAYQLISGLERVTVDVMGRLVGVLNTAKQGTYENGERTYLKKLLEKCHGRSS
jgi:hypothetical protein